MIAKPFVLQDKLHIAQKTQQPFQLRLMPRPAHLNEVFHIKGCLVQVGKDIELDAVGRQFEPYAYRRLRLHRWRPCGVTCDAVLANVNSRAILQRTSAFLSLHQALLHTVATPPSDRGRLRMPNS